MVPFQYNTRSLLVRKVTTVATVGGVALVVFVFAATMMFFAGVNRALPQSGRPDTVVILRKGSDAEMPSAIANEHLGLFRGPAQVAQSAGVIGESVLVITAELANGSGISNVLIRGTPPEGYAFRPELKIVEGRMPKPGTNEVIVGRAISGRFNGIALGQSFELRRNRPFQVVGIFSADRSSYESEVWGDLDVIRRSLGREGAVSSARVRLNSPADYDAYRQLIEGDQRFSMKVLRESDYYQNASEDTAAFLGTLGIIVSILFSLAAMIGAAITMNAAVAHRTREIGTLRALGFSRLSIMTSFLFESIVLAVAAGAIGSVLVLALSSWKLTVINFATFSDISIHLQATPSMFLWSLVFSLGMGLVGGLFPAIRASRVSPVEAMRA